MHVLFVIDTWGLIGGTERHATVVVPALVERGHTVTVLCREDQEPDFKGVETVRVIEVPELEGTGMSRPERDRLYASLREVAADVAFHSALRNVDGAEALVDALPVVRYVHDHTLFCPGLNKYQEDGETCRDAMGSACLLRYHLQGGCICFKRAGHAHPLVDPLRELTSKWRELDVARRAACVLTNSDYMRRELLKVGFAPERTELLYYFTRSNTPDQPGGPLDESTRAFVEETGGGPLIFTPARLTLPDKGVDYLLTVLGSLRRPFRAVIAGSGPAEEHLREKAVVDGVADRVHFSGWTPSTGIETLYEQCDVVVCPSVWDEPFGLVGIEAMVHEKPVVAFDVGGIPEWLADGETGYLVPRKDVGAMAAAIDRLLGDADLRQALGQNGPRLVAERFDRTHHLDRLEATLERAALPTR